jgi:Predicted acetyltransferase
VSAEPAIVIRDARPDEFDAIRELTRSAYAQYADVMTPSAWSGLRRAVDGALANPAIAQVIVADRAGELLGSVLLFPPESDAYGTGGVRLPWPEIRLLSVAPSARGIGVGNLLVAECVARARAIDATGIGLHSSLSMRSAIHLYERAGFVRDPMRDIHIDGAEPIEAYRLPLSPG